MTQVPKQSTKKSVRDIRRDLRVIYQGHDGNAPDMSRLARRKSSSLHSFLVKAILILFVLSIAAWSGFFFFSKGLFHSQDNLTVTIDGPTDNIKAGLPITYVIHYSNSGTVPLATLELSANFPDTFHISSAIPAASDKNLWKIGSLTPKSDGVITVNGMYLADVPTNTQWQAVFTYKPANFNSSFQQIETEKVNLTDSVLSLSTTGPEQALPGDAVTYTVTVADTDTNPTTNMRVVPAFPPEFNVTSTDPAFDANQTYWSLPSLDPTQPKTFTIHGTFTASANGAESVGANVGFVQDSVYLKQKDASAATTIQGGAIGVHLLLNGSSETTQSVGAGQALLGSITYTNQSTDPIGDIQFDLSLDGNGKSVPVDWHASSIQLQNGTVSTNHITWDKSMVPTLGNLKPNDNGAITFSLPITTSMNATTANQFTLKLITTITAKDGSTKTVASSPIAVSINSSVAFNPEARYYAIDGTAVGSGPLPPKVGKTTTYRIYWNVSNSLHDLSKITVSAPLPSNVIWKNSSSTDIGTITYKKSTDSVTWNIEKLPSSIPKAGAWFDVYIKPTAADAGNVITLVNASSFTATDTKTSNNVSITGAVLDTNVSTDATANGKGTVAQ